MWRHDAAREGCAHRTEVVVLGATQGEEDETGQPRQGSRGGCGDHRGALLVLASLVTSDVYRATTDGLILAVTGLIAHAVAGLLERPVADVSRTVPSAHAEGWPALSGREIEVLRELVNGARNSDIAETLGITERTVKAHVGSIYQKLGSRRARQLSPRP